MFYAYLVTIYYCDLSHIFDHPIALVAARLNVCIAMYVPPTVHMWLCRMNLFERC